MKESFMEKKGFYDLAISLNPGAERHGTSFQRAQGRHVGASCHKEQGCCFTDLPAHLKGDQLRRESHSAYMFLHEDLPTA